MSELLRIVGRHKAGEPVGITSVCSAHPTVIEAALRFAKTRADAALIEATSNQVDQFGGYTGMTPADFRDFVFSIADRVGFPPERIVLGGDHLGPNRWQEEPAEAAMAKAETLIEAYAAAGFAKIHLDCSMPCGGDPRPLTDAIVAGRAARLAAVAERTARAKALAEMPVYIVGTEVPVPGGAQEDFAELQPTSPEAARATIRAHREAFERAGLGEAWNRVVGLVVQPGVEFNHLEVVDYRPERARDLSRVVDDVDGMVFEAHSTDYQTPDALRALVEGHFAILKVGPGLTFALREALFALESIEREMVSESERSNLRATVDRRMVEEPKYWKKYYEGDEIEQRFARAFSLSDRIRYYWPDDAVRAAEEKLFANLAGRDIPLPLLSQYFPEQFRRVRGGAIAPTAEALVRDRVTNVIRDYAYACDPKRG